MNNPVGWFEIATTDLERAKAFYTQVFDSHFEKVEMGKDTMYMFAGDSKLPGTGGSLIHSEDNIPGPNGTMIYFSCTDVAVEASKIEAAGGKLIVPKTAIGPFGFIAWFIDTEGNKIGLHSNT